MRKAAIFINDDKVGTLTELKDQHYEFCYNANYQGAAVSLTMPIQQQCYQFQQFPAFFEGLLPEGIILEALLRKYKLDRQDYFGQLLEVGEDLVGAISVRPMP